MVAAKAEKGVSTIRRLFGVELSDFQSWTNFVKLMNRPEDPSSLAVLRILFGRTTRESSRSDAGLSSRTSDDAGYPSRTRDVPCGCLLSQ